MSLKVDTPKGKATLTEVYITELGHLMARIYYPKDMTWTNYRIGSIEELARTVDIELLTPFTKKIKLKKEVI